MHKTAGADNVANLLTKHLKRAVNGKHMGAMQLNLIDSYGDIINAELIVPHVVASCLSKFGDPDYEIATDATPF